MNIIYTRPKFPTCTNIVAFFYTYSCSSKSLVDLSSNSFRHLCFCTLEVNLSAKMALTVE